MEIRTDQIYYLEKGCDFLKILEYPFDSQMILNKHKRIKRQLLSETNITSEIKIAILCGSTIGEMQNVLELFLLNHGIKAVFFQGDYNRYYEDSVFENTKLAEFAPDFIYLHISCKNISAFTDRRGLDAFPKADEVFKHFQLVIEKAKEHYHCSVIVNNFEMLPYRVMGNSDCWSEYGELNLIHEVNQKLYQYVRNTNHVYMNDLNYEAAMFGLEKWHDNSLWYIYKYPFSLDAIPYVAFNIANIIKSIQGKNQKLIITDLDNTLWGGVIGDDGIENIKLGIETAAGMAYQEFQKYLRKISDRGIALTICSKNEKAIALKGLHHPASTLHEEDFVSIIANWVPKSVNVKRILREINLTQDSAVFLDDNRAEREEVKNELGKLIVPEFTKIDCYRDILDRSGYFEITGLTDADKNRRQYYQQNELSKEELELFTDYGEYLDSLTMTAYFDDIHEKNIIRVTQLLNRTNQFNLTGKRFSEEALMDYLKENEHIGICGRLTDKFGDKGITTVVLLEVNGTGLVITNWVMSCRVFKREFELAVFDKIVETAASLKLDKLIGTYVPTENNKPVMDLYQKLGFVKKGEREKEIDWVLENITITEKKNKHLKVKAELHD